MSGKKRTQNGLEFVPSNESPGKWSKFPAIPRFFGLDFAEVNHAQKA
jgi:hypothetical protein